MIMTEDRLACHVTGQGTSVTKAQTGAAPDCEKEADVSFIIRRWWGAATERAGPAVLPAASFTVDSVNEAVVLVPSLLVSSDHRHTE